MDKTKSFANYLLESGEVKSEDLKEDGFDSIALKAFDAIDAKKVKDSYKATAYNGVDVWFSYEDGDIGVTIEANEKIVSHPLTCLETFDFIISSKDIEKVFTKIKEAAKTINDKLVSLDDYYRELEKKTK